MDVTKEQVLAYLEPDEPNYASAAELGSEVLPILTDLLNDPRPGIAAKAASLAGKVGGRDAVTVLQKAARSADPVVRVAAAGASSGLSASEAEIVLAPLVADQDVGVQKTALNAAPVELPSALRAAIEQLDPDTADPAIMEMSQRALRVTPEADEEELPDVDEGGLAGEDWIADLPTGAMHSGDMATDDMAASDTGELLSELPHGDMPAEFRVENDGDGGAALIQELP